MAAEASKWLSPPQLLGWVGAISTYRVYNYLELGYRGYNFTDWGEPESKTRTKSPVNC